VTKQDLRSVAIGIVIGVCLTAIVVAVRSRYPSAPVTINLNPKTIEQKQALMETLIASFERVSKEENSEKMADTYARELGRLHGTNNYAMKSLELYNYYAAAIIMSVEGNTVDRLTRDYIHEAGLTELTQLYTDAPKF
jgi:hypothetical protein